VNNNIAKQANLRRYEKSYVFAYIADDLCAYCLEPVIDIYLRIFKIHFSQKGLQVLHTATDSNKLYVRKAYKFPQYRPA